MSRPKLMSIDPSINYCGVAIFDMKTKVLEDAVLIRPDKITQHGEWYGKAFSIYTKVYAIVEKCKVTAITVERPDHWSVAGFEARESGSIEKLAFLVGLFYSMHDEISDFKLFLPREWKGQLPKEVVRNRLAAVYTKDKYSKKEWAALDHNIMDSVAIGHFTLFGKV